MYSISIGDWVVGFTVIDGHSVAAPYFKSTVHFTFSLEEFVKESIDIQLKGTLAQINTAMAQLELIAQRAGDYSIGFYPVSQQLKFITFYGEEAYYAVINNVYLEANPAGYINQPQGSKVITLHYTRANYFDGIAREFPLSGRAGNGLVGGYPLYNHTDSGVNHGSSVLIPKAYTKPALPAPLKITFNPDTGGGATYKDIFLGLYHHDSYDSDLAFFYYYNNLGSGTSYANAGAIQGNYRRFAWAIASWNTFTYFQITAAIAAHLEGFSYRPFIHFFTTHAYTDLYLKVTIERTGFVMFESEPVYCPPNYGYCLLPPIDLPPNFLLNEVAPDGFYILLHGLRESGAATTLEIDCVTLFPLCYSATFYGFHNMYQNQPLIDDSNKGRHNLRIAAATGETVSHSRVGGPLLVPPSQNSRLFVYAADGSNLMPIAHENSTTVEFYPRIRIL